MSAIACPELPLARRADESPVSLAVIFTAGVVLMVSSKLALGFLQSFWEVE